MKKVYFLLFFIMFIVFNSFAQFNPELDINHYILTFYDVEPVECETIVKPGSMLEISFMPPFKRANYDSQPDPITGGIKTGDSLNVKIDNSNVMYSIPDSQAVFYKSISLAEGYYELLIKAVDNEDRESKYSNGITFQIIQKSPDKPALIYIKIKN